VGVRGLVQVIQHLPRILALIRLAEFNAEPTLRLWAALASSVAACVAGGILLLLSVLFLLLIEGTQVLVDEMGISVELGPVPGALARRLGAGRLTWKQVARLDKGRVFFILRGEGEKDERAEGERRPVLPVLRFLVVDQLDRLILTILERSPNLQFRD
jgi:hypothetical protein